MKNFIGIIVAFFMLGIAVSIFLSAFSIILIMALCLFTVGILIKSSKLKFALTLLLLSQIIKIFLGYAPVSLDRDTLIFASDFIFILGIYFMVRNGKKLSSNR
ncbi:hypothetical protein ACI6PS_02525 [Flavobacterium sp. PLA-1-15]|uniref:hypothetical protein n=1 Tax=Flavobacterium sp. PLA-1-15 TaxID=3380533 RepID=UPI003B8212EB